MNDYTPVSCEYHSHLEHLIIIAKPVLLSWLDESRQKTDATVTLLDIYTRQHAEFILVQSGTEPPFEIRLDQLKT